MHVYIFLPYCHFHNIIEKTAAYMVFIHKEIVMNISHSSFLFTWYINCIYKLWKSPFHEEPVSHYRD